MAVSSGSTPRPLDVEAFVPFGPLLEACQEYADLTGCRFQHGAFKGIKGEALPADSGAESPLLAAKLKASAAVEEFTQRLQLGDEHLLQCVEHAYNMVMSESVRNGIIATCREVGLWPPRPTPADVGKDDCTYQDTAASLPAIAQRAYNDELRRKHEEGLQVLVRRASTASFLVDFAGEAGVSAPALSGSHQEMLEEFMTRVEEWAVQEQQIQVVVPCTPVGTNRFFVRAREALLMGLGLSTAADAARKHVRERWSKNWDTPGGAILNVVVAGLAVAAGVAALHRAARPH